MDMEISQTLNDYDTSENTEKQIKFLEGIRNVYEENQNYEEASKSQMAILQLRREQKRKHEDRLIEKHTKERLELINDFNIEYSVFNDHWNDVMIKHKDKGQEIIKIMKADFSKEYELAKENLEKNSQISQVISSEYKALKEAQSNMIKQKEYEEANIIQKQLRDFENEEKHNSDISHAKQTKEILDGIKFRHKIDVKNIEKQSEIDIERLKNKRACERKELIEKYNKIKKKLQQDQLSESLQGQDGINSSVKWMAIVCFFIMIIILFM